MKLCRVIPVSLLVVFVLISSISPLEISHNILVNGATERDFRAGASDPSDAIDLENEYEGAISDRIVDVRRFDLNHENSGLQVSEERHGSLFECDVSASSFSLTTVKMAGSTWDIIACNNSVNLNNYGKPAVPYKKTLIPIGEADVENITISQNVIGKIPNVRVLPGLKPVPVGSSFANWSVADLFHEKDFYADPTVYCSNLKFPDGLVKQEVILSKGNRFLALTIFPFSFDPSNNTMTVYDIHIKVLLTEPSNVSGYRSADLVSSEDSDQYVIVIPPGFSAAAQSFSEWKEQIGFSVQVVSLDRIYREFDGRDQQERIRNFIRASHSSNGTQYFLLVGDCDLCPVREVLDPMDAGVGLDNGTEPTDLYYECLDGDWDANQNSVFGELSDNTDLYPEVKVGRIPVGTSQDAQRVLGMIRRAEEEPEPGEWIKNFLLLASSAFSPGDCPSALEEEINQKYLEDSFFDPIRLYDVDRSLSSSAVVAAMNSGVGLVDFFDHGAYDQWVQALRVDDVLNMHNGNKTFLAFAMACETAAFDYQEYTTIAEAFFRNQLGGAIGYIGATRIAWAGYDCFDGFHHRFWNYFLSDAIENMQADPKTAFHEALTEMASTYSPTGSTLETIYQAVYFGDPAFAFYWKTNVTTTVTPNLETEQNGTLIGTCKMMLSNDPLSGEYRTTIKDPTGETVAEQSGNLGPQGTFTVDFTTSGVAGNYSVRIDVADPFNFTNITEFTVGRLELACELDSVPIYGMPLSLSGHVFDDGNPVAGWANVSIMNKGVTVESMNASIDATGHFSAKINLTTFGAQTLYVWASYGAKHGGTYVAYRVERGNVLIIPYDAGEASLYPGGWYDYNKGSSTSYQSFNRALKDDYNVSVYRILYDEVPTLAFLKQYSAVILTCGDNYGFCLTNQIRNMTSVLTQFHNSGGDLLFEGGDLGYSLNQRRYFEFMRSVLHAEFLADLDNNGNIYLDNLPHAITQGMPSQIPLITGLGSPSVDDVESIGGSEKASGYGGFSSTGNSITAFPGASGTGAVVYFSFSVDGIDDNKYASLLIQNSLQYLLYPTLSVEASDDALLVGSSETLQIHVKDSDTKQPKYNATVALEGCGVSIQNETDSLGVCSLLVSPTSDGTINVTVEKTGYPDFTFSITVYAVPKLSAQITPERLRKKTQPATVAVTDFYEHTPIDSAAVLLSGCGVNETTYTDPMGTAALMITPTQYGHMQLTASKQDYENYTELVDVCVNAVIVDSFGSEESLYSTWDELNAAWETYGNVPVNVDVESLSKHGLTYQDLVTSEADVLIISCAAAVGREYTDSEISAIRQYTLEGHGLIATAGTLYQGIPNNNKLADLFGMKEEMIYAATYASGGLKILDPLHPLFVNVSDPYQIGNGQTSCPPDYSWDENDLFDGTYLAKSLLPQYSPPPNGLEGAAIIEHKGAVFITHWIEYGSSNQDIQLMYNAVVWSKYETPEHDLMAILNVASYGLPNQTFQINLRISNVGKSTETNVPLVILINDTLLQQRVIQELHNLSSYDVNYEWVPRVDGTFNITLWVEPVGGEVNIANNQVSRCVEIRYPLINPLQGQRAKYHGTFLDRNGEEVGYENLTVIYDRYIDPCLIRVKLELSFFLDTGQGIIIMNESSEITVNTVTRFVQEYQGMIDYYYPYWVEASIGLGSTVKLGTSTAIVVGENNTRVQGRPIYCWLLTDESADAYNYTYMFDKATGVLVGERGTQVIIPTFQTREITFFEMNLIDTNIPIGYPHELEITVNAPVSMLVNQTASIELSIHNYGTSTEANVSFSILIEENTILSGMIPQLGNGSSFATRISWSPTRKGSYNLTAYVQPVTEETATENNLYSRIINVSGDDLPPRIFITSPSDHGITNATSIMLTWEGYDNESRIGCYSIYLNDQLFTSVSADVTSIWLSISTEGTNDIIVRAYDIYGNSAEAHISLIADFRPPTAQLISPANGDCLKGSVSILTYCEDFTFDHMELYLNEDCEFSCNASGVNFYAWNTLSCVDGNCVVKLIAYDKAGNEASVDIRVSVDNSPPSVCWIAPLNGGFVSKSAALTFSCTDPNLKDAIIIIDGVRLTDVTNLTIYQLDTTGIGEGRHILTLTSQDMAGNSASQSIVVNVDSICPSVEIVAPSRDDILGGLCAVQLVATDKYLCNVTLAIGERVIDVTNMSQCTLDTTEIPDGTVTLTLTALDEVGNIASDSTTVSIDNTKPSVSITNSDALTMSELKGIVTIEFAYADENLEAALLYINQTVINVTGSSQYSWDTSMIGDGVYEVKVRAQDKAGNIAETTPLSARTVNIIEATGENYSQGWNLGLLIGAASGLALGITIGTALLVATRRKNRKEDNQV